VAHERRITDFTAINVKKYGVVGDGVTDDTACLQEAMRGGDNAIFLPPGRYLISHSLDVDLGAGGKSAIYGAGAVIIMTGAGPALRLRGCHQGTSNPLTVTAETDAREINPIVQGIEIQGRHPEADGITIKGTFKATINQTFIRNCRYGIHAIERNRDLLIDTCHIYNNRIGVYLDHVDFHQINISDSHISHNHAGGIKVVGGAIRNIQICGNDIEYNHKEGGSDIWFIAGENAIREGAIVGNTIQALPGEGEANIRFEGYVAKSPNKIGFFSISGNHIANQSKTNIWIKNSRGIVIEGNTLQGAERNIVIEDSMAIVCSQNTLDDNPDYRLNKKVSNVGGIVMQNSRYCSLQGNLLVGAIGGSLERGGAVEASNCAFLNINGCTIIGPHYRGIWLEDVTDSVVANCIVAPGEGVDGMLAAIAETGCSRRNLFSANRLNSGLQGALMLASAESTAHGNLVS
jgi:nitrous oxidase accessory protein NosD